MFDKIVDSLFTRARRGQERRYQLTARDVGQLMRLFGRAIAALSEAREGDTDALAVVDEAVGWRRPSADHPTYGHGDDYADHEHHHHGHHDHHDGHDE